MTTPSHKALVPFVSVDNMMRLVHSIGIETMLRDLAEYVEADFKRWELFDKTPRVASHSDVGVIELMPTSDGEAYGFKYVNGHPKNTKRRLANRNCLWVVGGCRHWLPGAFHRDDNAHCAAYRRDISYGG